MFEEKCALVRSIRSGVHDLVVYDGLNERDSLVGIFVEGALKRNDFTIVYVEDRKGVTRALMKRKNAALKKAFADKTLLIQDNNPVFGRPPNVSSYERFFRTALDESRTKGLQFSFLGQFPVEFYDSFEVNIALERYLDRNVAANGVTGLCLEPKNMFFTFEPEHLIPIIESHDSSLLARTPINKPVVKTAR